MKIKNSETLKYIALIVFVKLSINSKCKKKLLGITRSYLINNNHMYKRMPAFHECRVLTVNNHNYRRNRCSQI